MPLELLHQLVLEVRPLVQHEDVWHAIAAEPVHESVSGVRAALRADRVHVHELGGVVAEDNEAGERQAFAGDVELGVAVGEAQEACSKHVVEVDAVHRCAEGPRSKLTAARGEAVDAAAQDALY
jgi:hypothetical protein